jgi:Glycosyl hydrolase family 20, catalytic domain
MWMYDIAREQTPDPDLLRRFAETSLAAGYNAMGLYLEHRFAYPSVPWIAGTGALTPEMVQMLQREFPELQVIPLVNLLGHFEGALYAEDGVRYAAERFKGLQADPLNREFGVLAELLLDDVLDVFTSEIVHIGGDETQQISLLGDRASDVYGAHFGRFARRVLDRGRRPAIWGDMFASYPEALSSIPKETLIFDWHYFESTKPTAAAYMEQGYDVVTCPTIQTYNAGWMHVEESEANIREHVEVQAEIDTFGICVTTWEMALFATYETMIPAIRAAGYMLQGEGEEGRLLKSYGTESESHEVWARLMGVDLPDCGGIFGHSDIRSSLKCRLLLYGNPFLLWLRNREDLCGEPGTKALAILDHAISVAPNAGYRGVSEFVRMAIEFVRAAELAHQAYAERHVGAAQTHLMVGRQIFESLEKIAKANFIRFGGSRADIERCRMAREHIERVMRRIKQYGDESLGYLPSFETITHPNFTPYDQGNWWLINSWARE